MKYIIIIFLIIIVLFLVSNQPKKQDNKIKILVRQASRWSSASKQDKNLIVKVLHANYGAGYLWALNDIYTTSEIENETGIDYFKFRDEIIKIQDDANKELMKNCSSFNTDNSYLASLSN